MSEPTGTENTGKADRDVDPLQAKRLYGDALGTTPEAQGGHDRAPDITDFALDFPQFEIIELIGQGGMGAVYKARQLKLDRIVALKILHDRFSRNPEFVERFTREARALARLNHPNIVTLYDFGDSSGRLYVVMEYIAGLNLRQVIQARSMNPTEALALVPRLCDALQYAHEEGIIHRDIKPENILLDQRGRVKVADFGLAKLLGQSQPGHTLTGTGAIMGTPHYMAPEQLEHPQDVDHRADVYALGIVFYEMLTGELPLGRFQPPSKKVDIDVRLDEVVLRAMEREPDRRYQHASEVRTDVEAITTSPIKRTVKLAPSPGPSAYPNIGQDALPKRRLLKNWEKGKVGGLCAGIADYLGQDESFVRIGFIIAVVLLSFIGGIGLILIPLYFALCCLVPWDRNEEAQAFLKGGRHTLYMKLLGLLYFILPVLYSILVYPRLRTMYESLPIKVWSREYQNTLPGQAIDRLSDYRDFFGALESPSGNWWMFLFSSFWAALSVLFLGTVYASLCKYRPRKYLRNTTIGFGLIWVLYLVAGSLWPFFI